MRFMGMERFESIPLFPLGIMLLRGEEVALHIFEARYRQLFADAHAPGFVFGIPYTSQTNTREVGSFVELVRVDRRHPGGELDVTIRCTGHFEVQRFRSQMAGKLYPCGTVLPLPAPEESYISPELEYQLEGFKTRFPYDPFPLAKAEDTEALGLALRLSNEQKLKFIGMTNPEEREAFLLREIQLLEKLLVQEHATYKGIYLN